MKEHCIRTQVLPRSRQISRDNKSSHLYEVFKARIEASRDRLADTYSILQIRERIIRGKVPVSRWFEPRFRPFSTECNFVSFRIPFPRQILSDVVVLIADSCSIASLLLVLPFSHQTVNSFFLLFFVIYTARKKTSLLINDEFDPPTFDRFHLAFINASTHARTIITRDKSVDSSSIKRRSLSV